MIINFGQQSEPEISFAHYYNSKDIDLDDETAEIPGQVEISGTARRSSEIARLKGNLRGILEIACSRCLQPTDFELDTGFELDFVTLENYGSVTDETQLNDSDLSVSIYDGEQINLDEVVREQILLNLPMHQLCREDCAGLCLNCRANKNTNPCNCVSTEIDPRWSALKELKKVSNK